MKEPRIKIDHSALETKFQEHLLQNDNFRILFSAPYGAGKSTFLKDFLCSNINLYLPLYIYPINYSVSSNDVFELIKFDLLTEIINNYTHEVELTKEDFSIFLSMQMFLLDNSNSRKIIPAIISLFGKIGKPVAEFLKILDDTVTDFNSFRQEASQDEHALLKKYLNESEKIPGSIREKDNISKLILSLIERIKNKRRIIGSDVKSILIIDDLDRLDPEHVFRLFNVFSAHYEHNSSDNKFNFDKIIFVCDIENIRKMFHHKYGQDIDFTGYINKFYTTEVFSFDNKEFIKEKIDGLISTLKYKDSRFAEKFPLTQRSTFYVFLEWVLQSLVHSKELSLRSLINHEQIDIPSYSFTTIASGIEQKANNYILLVCINVLRTFFPDLETLNH